MLGRVKARRGKKRGAKRGGGAAALRRVELEQTATAEILRAMLGSPTDLQPVFEAILTNALRLCEASFAAMFTYDGEFLRNVAHRNASPQFARFLQGSRVRPSRETTTRRCALERGTIHTPDLLNDPEFSPPEAQRREEVRTALSVPMIREGLLAGVITLWRAEVRPFSDKQIALVETFADQAVIAIENVRLFNETKEALEQQTAISEILQVISGSPTDVRPVLSAVAERAARLCEAGFVTVFMAEDGVLRAAAYSSAAASHPFPEGKDVVPLDRSYIAGRAAVTGQTVHLEDVVPLLESEFAGARENQEKFGFRTFLAVPLLRDRKPIGVIAASRRVVRRFSDKQVALLETFADQAVIAIENVRLFNETKEALEQQKASGEVLQAISSSIADTAPVFDKILESCQRLFAGTIVGLNLVREDGMLHIGAYQGAHRAEFERIFPIPVTTASGSGLAILERRVVYYPDTEHGAEVPERTRQGCRTIGIKSAIFAPVLWEGRGVGAVFVGRDHVGSFSGKEIALLRTFADQAAIAIENVRLFNETKQALERQTATAEILAVISSSPTDTKPVFDAIVQGGLRLFADAAISVALPDGDQVRAAAVAESDPARAAAWRGRFPFPLTRGYMHGVAILDRKVVDIPDVRDAPPEMAAGARNFLASGYRGISIMPMMRGEEAIGALSVVRLAPGPLSDKQLAVLKTFADQAVIAIENVRLFNEIREKSRQLEVASRHKSEFLANMSHELRTPLNAIIGFTRIVMRRSKEALDAQQYENLEKILASGQHLLALINAILDLSKIEAGRIELAPAETPLAPVLEQCLRTVEPLVKVSLVKEFDGGLPVMYVDEEKLRQIVINLLSNAAKFTEQGAIRVRARAANGSVAIAVADTGSGIARDKLGMIFEEFEQVDASSTREHGGTGLGLAIARRLARLMGGDIGVESAPGKGSTFTLTLPLRCPA
jgi:signal transduction histidine kinase/putative methionine-R-sulfoxide reductase with GAF domain